MSSSFASPPVAPSSSSSASVRCAIDAATLSLRASLPPRTSLRPAPTFYPTEEQFKDPLAYVQSIRHIGEKTGVCKIVPPSSWRPPMCLDHDAFQFRSKVQRIDMLQQRGQGGQTGAPADATPDAEATATATSNLPTLPGAVPAASPRKPSDSVGCESPYAAQGSPTAASESDTGTSARVTKRASQPPAFFSAEQAREAAVAAAGAKRKRDTSTSGKRAAAARRKRAKGAAGSGIDPYSNVRCGVCQGADHDGQLLLCDECDMGFHQFCLSPPLASIPATDWYCPSCQAAKMNEFGFECGRTFTLTQFKRHADEFLEKWFTKERAAGRLPQPTATDAAAALTAAQPDEVADGSGAARASAASFIPPSPADISRSFWHIVESSREAVSVDYGSDLDTEYLGSAFPRTGPYADHPFNVNNLPMAKGGIFNWLDDSMLISGVTVPWLYVGMTFSTFCWHVEDHNMMSINYVHEGASKQWYGVPSSSAGRFERKMRQALPNLFNLNPDLLFQLVTMLNPLRIATHASEEGGANGGASDSAVADDPAVYYMLQNAGEMAITFPRSYHAGFNHGFNIAESSNFAGVEWLPYGAKCIERYRFFRRTPIFNHEELVWRMAEHAVAAFEQLVARTMSAADQGRAHKWKRKHELKDARARSVFGQSNGAATGMAAAAATAGLAVHANAIPAGAAKSDLHSLAQRNRQLSLATFEQVWYFTAWLLPALQELLSRETQGRAALHTAGTLRGKIWGGESMLPGAAALAGGAKKSGWLAPTLPIGSQVSATWQGNPSFNRDAPTDPSQLCWYAGTVIAWTPPTTAAQAAGATGGLYSVRFHEDGLVDEHVLPHHLRTLNGASQTAGPAKGAANEWLTYQACVDGGEGTGDAVPMADANAGGAQSEGPSGADGTAAVAMKRKLKKSAVDFAPEAASTLVSCAICRHALYLSCVRCSCSPEKASCLLHAQELCACDAASKTIHFRHTLWQMQNMLAAMETVINHRLNAKLTTSSSSSSGGSSNHAIPSDTAAMNSSAPSLPAAASSEFPSLPPVHYCPLTDMYEQSSSADQYPPATDAKTVVVRGTDPDNNFNSYPLQFTDLMPVFSMGVDEEDAGGNFVGPEAADESTPLDESLPMSTGGDGEAAAEPAIDSEIAALLRSVAPVDWQRPSNRLLQSILSESRRIMSESDDYVAAVGLRDEKLAEAAAATLAEEEMVPRSLEAQLDATAQPNRRFSRSAHQLRLRAAAAAAAPAIAAANTAAKDALVESTKQSLRAAADAWLQRYGWVLARHEENLRSFDTERTSLERRRMQRSTGAALASPIAATTAAPSSDAPSSSLPLAITAGSDIAGASTVAASSDPAVSTAMDEGASVKGEPATAADGTALPIAKDESPPADLAMSDVSAPTVAAPLNVADVSTAVSAVKLQPSDAPTATAPKPAVDAASPSIPTPILPAPCSSPRSFAFLTATELEFALHEGEKFICGDEHMLGACELYGVLLSWQSDSVRLAQQICSLDHLHKTMAGRSRKLGESFERECAYIASGRTSASTEVPKSAPYDVAQLGVDQAEKLLREVATCPVQIACVCGYGAVAATNKTLTAAGGSDGEAALPCATTFSSSSLSPATRAALSHLCDWYRFLDEAHEFLDDPDQILGWGDSHGRATALLERAPLSDPGSFLRLMSPLIKRLVAVSALPIKMRQKTRYMQLLRTVLEARKEGMIGMQHKRYGGGAYNAGPKHQQPLSSPQQLQLLPQQPPTFLSNSSTLPIMPFTFGPFGVMGATVAAGASAPPLFSPIQPSPLLSASFSATHTPHSTSAADGDASSSLPPASVWLRDVSAILNSAIAPPLYQVLYQYHLDAKRLFPSLAPLLDFSFTSLDEPSADALAALADDIRGLDPAQVVMWLRRLNAICWAGFWWLTGCRRLLDRASSSPLAMLTPIPTQHDQPAALLDALPVPPLLDEWASGHLKRRYAAMAGAAQDAPDVPTLPWCSDVLGHAAASIARTCGPSSAASGDKFPCCCARTLLTANILSMVDIPESQVLEYLAQQCADWTRRARDILPAEAYREAGVQPPQAAEQAERAVLEISAHEGRTLDSPSFRLRCGSGTSIPLLVGIVWESSGIGFAPPELFILARHMERCQSWQLSALRVVQSSHRVLVSFYSAASDAHPSLDALQTQMREIETTLQEAESLAVWTEEGHALVRMWQQASAIIKRLGVSNVQPQQMQIQQVLAQAQLAMQMQMQAAAASMFNPAAAAAALFGGSTLPPVAPTFTPQQLQQLAASGVLSPPSAAHASAAPVAPSASSSLLKAESAAEASALAAPPPSSEVVALAPGQRYPMVRTIGEMLARMSFVLNNPLAQAMDRDTRETFWGFSSQTLQRYQRHAQRAKEAGIDLAKYAPVNYQDISALISASPMERETLLAEAIVTGGAHKRVFKQTAISAMTKREGASDDEGAQSDDSEGATRADRQPGGRRRQRKSTVGAESLIADIQNLSPIDALGLAPVERVELLPLPAPTEAQRDDTTTVYARRSLVPGQDYPERRRLLAYVKSEGFFTPPGLLPFQALNFGQLHSTRKTKAIRMIQDEFRTCPIWTRKFLASTHGNNRRLLLDRQNAAAEKAKRLKQLNAMGGASSAAAAAAAAAGGSSGHAGGSLAFQPYKFAPPSFSSPSSAPPTPRSHTAGDHNMVTESKEEFEVGDDDSELND